MYLNCRDPNLISTVDSRLREIVGDSIIGIRVKKFASQVSLQFLILVIQIIWAQGESWKLPKKAGEVIWEAIVGIPSTGYLTNTVISSVSTIFRPCFTGSGGVRRS